MCCCENSCKCCACTIVADAAIWAAIFIHLNAFVALMNLHMIPLVLSIVEALVFWIFIFNRSKRGPRRAFYYVYMLGTVGSLVGYLWYIIWMDKEKDEECSNPKDPYIGEVSLRVDRMICERKYNVHEGY